MGEKLHREYRAVYSYPPSILGETPDEYSEPVTDKELLPDSVPRADENHGWVSGVQARWVTDWGDD